MECRLQYPDPGHYAVRSLQVRHTVVLILFDVAREQVALKAVGMLAPRFEDPIVMLGKHKQARLGIR